MIEDDDGGLRFTMNESFIGFGVGKRDCVGRQLAMKEIQFTLGHLLLNYKISLMNEKEDINKNITLMRETNMVTAYLHPSIPIKLVKI